MSLKFRKKRSHADKRGAKSAVIPNPKIAAGALVAQASRIEQIAQKSRIQIGGSQYWGAAGRKIASWGKSDNNIDEFAES